MIAYKSGPGSSLQQSNQYGTNDVAEAVVAGMVVRRDTAGVVRKGGIATNLFGFATNSYNDSNVEESGVLGIYLLDGGTVLSTDQAALTINSTNFPLGTALYPQTGGTGLVTTANTIAKVIGWVEDIRVLPADKNTVTNGYYHSVPVTVLDIKLAA